MNESPTPYDILPPSPFPFALPSYSLPALLILICGIGAYWWYRSRGQKVQFSSTEAQIRSTLSALSLRENLSSENLNRLRLQLLRYLERRTGQIDALSYTESDLHQLAASNTSVSALNEICNLLILIENMRYSHRVNAPQLLKALQDVREEF